MSATPEPTTAPQGALTDAVSPEAAEVPSLPVSDAAAGGAEGPRRAAPLARVFDFFSSIGLSVACILYLGVLTWAGTLAQVEIGLFEAQKRFFESWFFLNWFGKVPVPLPGGQLTMWVLCVNLVCGGFVRMRWDRARAGILVTHAGILMLLVAGIVKLELADEGSVLLFEGQKASSFESYHDWEAVVIEPLGDGKQREHVVPAAEFSSLTAGEQRRFASASLPFDLEFAYSMRNARPFPRRPMARTLTPLIDGYRLEPEPLDKQNERNLPGVYASVLAPDRAPIPGILWAGSRTPWTFRVDGRVWGLELRRKSFPMPFELVLDDFQRDLHPGTGMAANFESKVTVRDGGLSDKVHIKMNEPLRRGGIIVFQSGWGPENPRPGQPLYSRFSVVRNPADQLPLVACVVIAVGMFIQFTRTLLRYLRAEARRQA